MPELPEVETVCRGLRKKLTGRRITRVVQQRADLRKPLPTHFPARLKDREVRRIDRRAKYILLHLDSDLVLIIHLGMSGRLLIHDNPNQALEAHDRTHGGPTAPACGLYFMAVRYAADV